MHDFICLNFSPANLFKVIKPVPLRCALRIVKNTKKNAGTEKYRVLDQ
jgi:hypothetical protein